MTSEQQHYFTIAICFTIGYGIYKIIEKKFGTRIVSIVAHTLMVVEVIYLCIVVYQDIAYTSSVIELIAIGIFLSNGSNNSNNTKEESQ